MAIRSVRLFLAALAALAVASCSGAREPGDATGAKVLRNLLDKNAVGAKLVSFKKTNGRQVSNAGGDAYEFWYEAELQFPDGFEAKCADEKERGTCAFLGLGADQTFAKNEVLKSEGTLHFVKKGDGWLAEDKNSY